MFSSKNNSFNVVSTQDPTSKQLKSFKEFDEKVTGMNLSLFLEYLVPMIKSLTFNQILYTIIPSGVVILDPTDSVVDFAAAGLCRHMENK